MPDTIPERFTPEAILSAAPTEKAHLPQRLLYATSSGIGGTGLDSTSLEGATTSHEAGFLAQAIAFGGQQSRIPQRVIRSLNGHPVRLLSCLGSERYYAAKKRYVDVIAARELRTGDFDAVHGWSGDCFRTLVEARLKGVPSVIDIPTWHRNKGARKLGETKSERADRLAARSGLGGWLEGLPIDRPRMLAEYELADVILTPSWKATETFLAAGVPAEKLCYVARGVDPARYSPGTPPETFRVIFVGALIKRKGVHHLLEAWAKLRLRDAELVLVGSLHEEMQPHLHEHGGEGSGVRHLGFSSSVQDELRRAALFVFPSECEGFAKTTLEAAACALPIITTAESGDAVRHGLNGWIIPPNDPQAIAMAIEHAYRQRDQLAAMGAAGRQRVLDCLTWRHYRQRMLQGYARARARLGA